MIIPPNELGLHRKLEEWGSWARECEVAGYPPVTLLGRLIEFGAIGASHPSEPPISIPQSVALIDSAVAKLEATLRSCLIAYYTHWESIGVSARRVGLDEHRFAAMIGRARKQLLILIPDSGSSLGGQVSA